MGANSKIGSNGDDERHKKNIFCQIKHRNKGRATLLFDIIDLIIIFRILVITKICVTAWRSL